MSKRKILISSDHAGLALKTYLKSELGPLLSEVDFVDLGPDSEKSVDYPDFAKKLCEGILAKQADLGILICGSGQGMAMQANRFKGIRAALCWDVVSSKLSRQHNNSNVLCLGSRLIPFGTALEMVKAWLSTPFEGDRHLRRLEKMDS